MSPSDLLLQFLASLPEKSYEHELDFTRDAVPKLVHYLGYSEAETFYDFSIGKHRADVALSNSIDSAPWILVELKRKKSHNLADWVYQLNRNLDALNCQTGFVLSTEILLLSKDRRTTRYQLKEITHQQVENILSVISRASQPDPMPSPTTRERGLAALIDAVEQASSNDEKGRSLELLARTLFDSTPMLGCKYSNLQTRSSEVDIVVEYNFSLGRIPLFDELGRFALVECKNWSKPVGVAPVRDFMGKLDKCKVSLGIIFSKNGVTGIDSGADALREIQSRFDRNGTYILIFSLDDARRISNGKDFLALLDEKSDALRFDMESG